MAQIFWTFFSGDEEMKKFKAAMAMVITALMQVFLAGIIYGSLRDNETIKFYLGFMNGRLSKALFFLFCAFIVFPVGYNGSDNWKWVFTATALFLVFIAS